MYSLPTIPSQTTGTKVSDVYDTTGDPRVDLNVKCVRGASVDSIKNSLKAILDIGSDQAYIDAVKIIFNARNIRGGKGERQVFYDLFESLATYEKKLVRRLIPLIPDYGSWRDINVLMDKALKGSKSLSYYLVRDMTDLYQNQIAEDKKKMENELPISLAAKWAPRENSKYGKVADLIAFNVFRNKPKQVAMELYRKTISSLNAYLKTVEVDMCRGTWADIEPSAVPGRAAKLYNRAFLNLESTYKDGKHNPTRTQELRYKE